jgi:hypothetical protein
MADKFYSPSINIIRDFDKPFQYIPTPNSKSVYDLIINNYSIGVRSFNIVGSYGTGKSSFIWAFEKNVNNKIKIFPQLNGYFKDINKFEFFPIIGDYASFIESFSDKLEIPQASSYSARELLKKFDSYYRKLHKSNTGLLIVADEFGKFLEYASNNSPEQELYFIQLLAEYVNDVDKNILFITTLHQNFSSYAYDLTNSQRQEWDKVKGRLKEITFNEPVEQLLYLAAERLKQENRGKKKHPDFDALFAVIEKSKAFPLKDYFNKDIAQSLQPFDILAASILTSALQKYGQNERSLFSFIESKDYLGLGDYDKSTNPYYNISCVFDYLLHNYHSYLTSKHNTHFPQWSTIRLAIEKVEGIIDVRVTEALKTIKIIGLLNIFCSAAANLDKDFLNAYCQLAGGINKPAEIIKLLETNNIIKYSKPAHKYIFANGTDLDIELAIIEAGNQIDKTLNVVSFLNRHFDFTYVQAKEVFYLKGTPRFFSFKISETPIETLPDNNIDGTINLVFSEHLKESDVKNISAVCEEAIIYGYFKNFKEIKSVIFEIEKTQKVRENHPNDTVAVKELDSIIAHYKQLLNQSIYNNLFSGKSVISWCFKGEIVKIKNHKEFNRILSRICEHVYHKTPEYKCELINKVKPSGTVISSKKNLFKQLVENNSLPDLGFNLNKFPPEKTIYRSLLRETGIHIDGAFFTDCTKFANKSFIDLWQDSFGFIQKSKSGKLKLGQFVEMLSEKPYKLKKGFIGIWIPVFLFIYRNDFALFDSNGYIFDIDDNILDLISKSPEDYEIKAFDVEGVRLELFNNYRSMINQSSDEKPSSQSFIELIKPFLAFYDSLPEYAKKTKIISKRAILLRDAIRKSEDPEKSFFDDFPNALNYNIVELSKNRNKIEEYIKVLQDTVREIRMSYTELIIRIEDFICSDIIGENLEFPLYREKLKKRFSKLKKYLLPSVHKIFYQRLISDIDNNSIWINSISQALLGKSLENIEDDEEKILYEKLRNIIFELDNLCEISKAHVDSSKEDLIKFEITTFVKGLQKRLVRIPKNKSEEIAHLKAEIEQKLSKFDKVQNIALLIKLLQDQIDDGKKA